MVDSEYGSAEEAVPVRVQKYSGFRWPLSFANMTPSTPEVCGGSDGFANAADPPLILKDTVLLDFGIVLVHFGIIFAHVGVILVYLIAPRIPPGLFERYEKIQSQSR